MMLILSVQISCFKVRISLYLSLKILVLKVLSIVNFAPGSAHAVLRLLSWNYAPRYYAYKTKLG